MEQRVLFRLSQPTKSASLFMILLVSFIQLQSLVVEGAILDDDSSKVLCDMDFSSFLPLPYGSLPNMACKPLWNSYVLRYSQSKNNVITIVLSSIYTGGWVGMGFSRDGMMLNASCMVGWITTEGRGRIKQYHVRGFTPSEIKPDEGELPLTSVPPYVALNGAKIYLAFQLKYNKTLKTQPVLLAFSTRYPHHLHLPIHEDKTTISFDFSSGDADSIVDVSSNFIKDKRTHGILSLLGWGLLLPFGAVFARYLKHKDPLWYYLHVVIQFSGFLFGVAALVVGLALDKKLHASIPTHKGIGVFVFVLTVLQVLAFFSRPSRDSKYRKYWNWYHNWLGRICLFFGAVNVVVGIHLAGAGAAWKIGYGLLVGALLIICIVLETLLRIKWLQERDIPPALSTNSL
ncbi:cytochrome b561 and DOMON domain-containing protein At3g61750 [Primulina eburnea]|uniref:cytochrome b561 and DOMON domain-containing protein At3g61750 n=1 Tax=Primulina eburnea TaxID=1245227 RepID=UPI003C6BF1F1